jgi:hypothetical protein
MLSLDTALTIGALVLASAAPQAPLQAREDRAAIAADAVATGDLLANDAGGRGPVTVIAIAGGEVDAPFVSPAGAQVLVRSTGAFRYDPAGAFAALALGAEAEERLLYRVSDGARTAEAELVVTITGVNRPPVPARKLPDQSLTLGAPVAPIDAAADFLDPGDALVFSAQGLPAGLSIGSATGAITGTPAEMTAGRVVTITARDSAGQEATSAFQITVTEAVPEAPLLSGVAPAQTWTLGQSVTSLTLSASFDEVSGPAVDHYLMAPGSDALPAGVTLDPATGAISGTPTEAVPTARQVVIRAVTAEGAFSDVAFDVTVPGVLLGPALNAGSPRGINANDGSLTSIGTNQWRVTESGGVGWVRQAWPVRLIAGRTYQISASVARETASGTIFLRAAADNALAVDRIFEDATPTGDADKTVQFTATATTAWVGLAVGMDAAGNQTVAIRDFRVQEVDPPAVPMSVGVLTPPVVQLGAATSIDLSQLVPGASGFFVDPASAPVPEGFSLSGARLIGSGAAPGDFTLLLGARDAAGGLLDDQGVPARAALSFTVADILPAAAATGPAWVVGKPLKAFNAAALFGFTPDVVTLRPGSDLPAGLVLDGGAITGTPTIPLPAGGAPVVLVGRTATQYQEVTLQTFAGVPVANLITGFPAPFSGTALVRTDLGGGRFRLTNPTGSTVNATYSWNLGPRPGQTLEVRVGIQASYLASFFGAPGNQLNSEIIVGLDTTLSSAATDVAGAKPSTDPGSYATVSLGPVTVGLAATLYLKLQFGDVPAGGWVEFNEATVFDVNAVAPIALGALFDVTETAVPDPAAAPFAPENVIRLNDAFWPSSAAITLEGDPLPAGRTLAAGTIRGKATEVATRAITVRASVGANSVTDTFTLTAQDAINDNPSLVDGPLGVRQQGPVRSTVTRTGQSEWKVTQREGRLTFVQRLSGLTKGARYSISYAGAAGSVPAGTMLTLRVNKHVMLWFGENVVDRTWPVQNAAPTDMTFIAPSTNPWVHVSVPVTNGETLIFNGVTVAPLTPADAYEPMFRHRLEPATTPAAGVTSRRLFNLKFGRRYAVTVAGGGDVFVARNPDAAQGAVPGASFLELVTDQWAAPVTGAEFIAQDEILWLVGKNGADLSAATVAEVAFQWPPAIPVPDAGVRFPFTTAYAVPAGTAVAAGTNLAAFVNSTAVDGTTYILADGDYTGGTITRRFTQGVRLIAATQYGARLTSTLAFQGARRVEVAGLYSPASSVNFEDTQDVVFRHNLLRRNLWGSSRHPNHWLSLIDNDIVGGPISGGDFTTNPLDASVSISTVHHMRVIGNRVWGNRSDHFNIQGQFAQIDHNLFGESFNGPDDHPDIFQSISPVSDNDERRYNSWWAMRMNAFYDDINGLTGENSGSATVVGQGVNHGNQWAAWIGLEFHNNILTVEHPAWALSVSDVHRDYRVTQNSMAKDGPLNLSFGTLGTFSGEVANNVTFRVTSLATTNPKPSGVADQRAVWVHDNWAFEGAKQSDPSGVYADATTIYGYGPGALAIAGGHTAKGATALVAELGAAAAPEAFSPTMWEAAPGTAGQIVVTLRTLPRGSDTLIPAFQYSIDGGAWTALSAINPPFSWTHTIGGVAAGSRSVQVRTVTGKGGLTSAASAAKAVVVK